MNSKAGVASGVFLSRSPFRKFDIFPALAGRYIIGQFRFIANLASN